MNRIALNFMWAAVVLIWAAISAFAAIKASWVSAILFGTCSALWAWAAIREIREDGLARRSKTLKDPVIEAIEDSKETVVAVMRKG